MSRMTAPRAFIIFFLLLLIYFTIHNEGAAYAAVNAVVQHLLLCTLVRVATTPGLPPLRCCNMTFTLHSRAGCNGIYAQDVWSVHGLICAP